MLIIISFDGAHTYLLSNIGSPFEIERIGCSKLNTERTKQAVRRICGDPLHICMAMCFGGGLVEIFD